MSLAEALFIRQSSNKHSFRHGNRDIHGGARVWAHLALTSWECLRSGGRHLELNLAVASSLLLQPQPLQTTTHAGSRREMEAELVHRAPTTEPASPAAEPTGAPAPEVEAPEQDELQSREPSPPAPVPPAEPAKENDTDTNEPPAQAIEESPLVELAPLPTEFNPDATPPPPLPPKDEEDELAFEPHPDPEPEPEPEHQTETNYEDNPELYRSLAVLTQYEDGEDQTGMEVDYEQQPEEVLEPPVETTETVGETVSEEPPVNGDAAPAEETGDVETGANGEADDNAMDVEQPPDQQEEIADSPMREPSMAPTSPLSDIPDLPQEIDFSEQKPKEPTPPPVKRKPSRAGSETEEGAATKKPKKEQEEQGPNVRPARGKLPTLLQN